MFPRGEAIHVTIEPGNVAKQRRTEWACWVLAVGCLGVLGATLLRKVLWTVCCLKHGIAKECSRERGPAPPKTPKRCSSCIRSGAPRLESAPIPHGKHVEVHPVDGGDRLQREENRLERGDDVDQLSVARFVRDLHFVVQIVVDFGPLLHVPPNLPIKARAEKNRRKMVADISHIVQDFAAAELVEIRVLDPVQHVLNAV